MRVIVLDNDWAVLRSLQIQLRRRGFDADCYSIPSKALDALPRGEPPAALVVDLVMPEMDGAAFIRAARPLLHEECRVILISGHTDVVEKTPLDDLGEIEFLPKPLDVDGLIAAIEKREEADSRSSRGEDSVPG